MFDLKKISKLRTQSHNDSESSSKSKLGFFMKPLNSVLCFRRLQETFGLRSTEGTDL